MSPEINPEKSYIAKFAVPAEMLPATDPVKGDVVDAELVPHENTELPDNTDVFSNLMVTYRGPMQYLANTREMLGDGLNRAGDAIVNRITDVQGLSFEEFVANPEYAKTVLDGTADFIDILSTRLSKQHPQARAFLTTVKDAMAVSLADNKRERILNSSKKRDEKLAQANEDYLGKKEALLREREASEQILASMKGKLQTAQGQLVTELPNYRGIRKQLSELYTNEDKIEVQQGEYQERLDFNKGQELNVASQLAKLDSELAKLEIDSKRPNNQPKIAGKKTDKYLLKNKQEDLLELCRSLEGKIADSEKKRDIIKEEAEPLRVKDLLARKVLTIVLDQFRDTLLKPDQDKIVRLLKEVSSWPTDQIDEFLSEFDPEADVTSRSDAKDPSIQTDSEKTYVENEVRLQILAKRHLGENPNINDRDPMQVEKIMLLALNVLEIRVENINAMNLAVDQDFSVKSRKLLDEKEESYRSANESHKRQIDTVQALEEKNARTMSEAFDRCIAELHLDDTELQETINQLNGFMGELSKYAEAKKALLHAVSIHETTYGSLKRHEIDFEQQIAAAEEKGNQVAQNVIDTMEAAKALTGVDGEGRFRIAEGSVVLSRALLDGFGAVETINGASRQREVMAGSSLTIEEERFELVKQINNIDQIAEPRIEKLVNVLRSISQIGTRSHAGVEKLLTTVTPILERLVHQKEVSPEDLIRELAPMVIRSMQGERTRATRAFAHRVGAQVVREIARGPAAYSDMSIVKKLGVQLGVVEDPRQVIDVDEVVNAIIGGFASGDTLELELAK